MDGTAISLFGTSIFLPSGIANVALAALFGFAIGSERAWRNKVASLRTFSMISAGSCLFTQLSIIAVSAEQIPHDPTRIAAQIVAGVGFLGGGVIFKTLDRVEGITTAAMIWLTAAIGMACGFNHVGLALGAFLVWGIIDVVSISAHRLMYWCQGKKRNGESTSVAEAANSDIG